MHPIDILLFCQSEYRDRIRRDMFAAAALTGLLTDPGSATNEQYAHGAVQLADALILELDKDAGKE